MTTSPAHTVLLNNAWPDIALERTDYCADKVSDHVMAMLPAPAGLPCWPSRAPS